MRERMIRELELRTEITAWNAVRYGKAGQCVRHSHTPYPRWLRCNRRQTSRTLRAKWNGVRTKPEISVFSP